MFWKEGQATNRPICKSKINIYEVKIRNYFKLHTFDICFYFFQMLV